MKIEQMMTAVLKIQAVLEWTLNCSVAHINTKRIVKEMVKAIKFSGSHHQLWSLAIVLQKGRETSKWKHQSDINDWVNKTTNTLYFFIITNELTKSYSQTYQQIIIFWSGKFVVGKYANHSMRLNDDKVCIEVKKPMEPIKFKWGGMIRKIEIYETIKQ